MKIINTDGYCVHLLTPTCGKIYYESFLDTRIGWELKFDTGIKYLRKNSDMGDWFDFRILGFGIGIYWGYPHGKR